MLDLGGEKGRAAGCVGTDPLRLTVSFEGGIGGYEADEILIEGMYVHTISKALCGDRGDSGGEGGLECLECSAVVCDETMLQTSDPPLLIGLETLYVRREMERVRPPRAHTHNLPPPPSPPVRPPRMHADFGVYAELPAPGYITFVFGPGSTAEHGQKLAEALRHIAL